ncbi:porin [Sutterella megalosphaeroides]|uniref:Porin n=1 Tax=Sutterella megalosphaeroides TaxID=2494234 RepID=A0A2Z6IB10_9BURK|nr:porin [Sutterella megalosphaeroides]BBF23725.1 porin [Sutterella megalosphaeroides]
MTPFAPTSKSLLGALTVAALGLASGVQAADVSVYGILDLGLNYQRVDNGHETSNTFQMMSGQNAMSRFGFKGSEDLGNGLKLGFVLENGFDADNGQMKFNRLFSREAQVNLSGDFGQVKVGRLVSFLSGYNTTGLFGPKVSPFSTMWVGVPGHKSVMTGDFVPYDNMVVYHSPSIAGVKLHGAYSFGNDTTKATGLEEGSAEVDRLASLAMSVERGPVYFTLIWDKTFYGNEQNVGHFKDAEHVSAGGNVDFGFAKFFAAAQWFDGVRALGETELAGKDTLLANDAGVKSLDGMTGAGVNLGALIPVSGGRLKLNTGFMKAENADEADRDLKRWTVSAGYEYPLSKRTFVYTGLGYMNDSYGKAEDANRLGFASGMVHTF